MNINEFRQIVSEVIPEAEKYVVERPYMWSANESVFCIGDAHVKCAEFYLGADEDEHWYCIITKVDFPFNCATSGKVLFDTKKSFGATDEDIIKETLEKYRANILAVLEFIESYNFEASKAYLTALGFKPTTPKEDWEQFSIKVDDKTFINVDLPTAFRYYVHAAVHKSFRAPKEFKAANVADAIEQLME